MGLLANGIFVGDIILYMGLLIWVVTLCKMIIFRKRNKNSVVSLKDKISDIKKNKKTIFKVILLLIFFLCVFYSLAKIIVFLWIALMVIMGSLFLDDVLKNKIVRLNNDNYTKKLVNIRHTWYIGTIVIVIGCMIPIIVNAVIILFI
ncbi:MAG: hypothetical protein ABF991_11015 [Liquorilactobacillus hordei]|uniref:DUF4181 domain-containing protein n=1 Tax=Liquorilactobacillus hordei TaxID=468911 RepID=A0A3S6QQS7_9LACO|nr:hypothetical protein [Liquorilactobacillus hordei]AUJ30454.1 hypothetical protein BSQ49_09825 [Liquorilactobacillus hordei]